MMEEFDNEVLKQIISERKSLDISEIKIREIERIRTDKWDPADGSRSYLDGIDCTYTINDGLAFRAILIEKSEYTEKIREKKLKDLGI